MQTAQGGVKICNRGEAVRTKGADIETRTCHCFFVHMIQFIYPTGMV